MKSLLVFQHVAYELLGTLHPLLKQAGFRIRYVNFERDPGARVDTANYDGLIVLGGPMGVYETEKFPHLAFEIEAIQEAVKANKPVLGICLGAQLIAKALGAKVGPAPQREIGWYGITLTEEGKKDPLLGELSSPSTIFQWHQDTFEIPDGTVWLARSQTCPHQAFRYGDRVYGFQFHLEVDPPMITRWLEVYRSDQSIEAQRILADTQTHVGAQLSLGHRVFSKYLQLFSTKKRRVTLGSKH